jgi:hypothetical protein
MKRLGVLSSLFLICSASPVSLWRQIEGTAGSLHDMLQDWAVMGDQTLVPAISIARMADYIKQTFFPQLRERPVTPLPFETQLIEQNGIVCKLRDTSQNDYRI